MVSVTAPFFGRVSDIFGRRNILILGNAVGVIGCIISATATSITVLIVGAVFLGFASSMDLLGWAAVGETVPKKYRPVALGMYEVTITPSTIFAVLIGMPYRRGDGMLIVLTSNSPYVARSYSSGLAQYLLDMLRSSCSSDSRPGIFYHPVNQYIEETGKSKWDQVKSIDYIGTGLFTIGLCLMLTGLSFGGTKFPWYVLRLQEQQLSVHTYLPIGNRQAPWCRLLLASCSSSLQVSMRIIRTTRTTSFHIR